VKLALIPPRAHLEEATGTGYQLLLPQHCDDNDYFEFYRRRRACGDYLMLDNGAAEGIPFAPEELLTIGMAYMVNEIVVPDVLRDMATTRQLAVEFESLAVRCPQFNYMAVVQGRTMDELRACADVLGDIDYIDTLAIPRHVETTAGLGARAELVRHIFNEVGTPIHLLGCNPEVIDEMGEWGETYRRYNVRGVDTASPFYYTMSHTLMAATNIVFRRPEDYFELKCRATDLLEANISIMKNWVYGG
jgi:hypothetical protein